MRAIPHSWTLRLIPELKASVEGGAKTLELRIESGRNRWLIEQVLQYQPGDRLTLEFPQNGSVTTRITAPTTSKPFREVSDDEVARVVGYLQMRRAVLLKSLQQMYGLHVDEDTVAHLAAFECT